MSGDKRGRILDRLAEIEGELAALRRELAEIDEVIDEAGQDEAERHAQLVSAIADTLGEP